MGGARPAGRDGGASRVPPALGSVFWVDGDEAFRRSRLSPRPGPAMSNTLLARVAGAVPGLKGATGLGGVSHRPLAGPQPFEVPCPTCGAAVVGTRTDRGRFEPCGACAMPAFVLPVDVYPRPPAPKKPVWKKTRSAPASAPATTKEPAAPSGPGLRERVGTRLAAVGPAVRKRATPVRLAAAGTVLIVAGTLWWAARGAGVEAARQTLVDAPPAASEALGEGRFEDAAARFAAEAEALATLGRGDSVPAKLARQKAREATAAAGLASQTPLQIAAEAAAARTPTARTAWANAFDALHRGRWVVLDTLAAAVPPSEPAAPRRRGGDGNAAEPAGPPPPRVELLYPLAAGDARARLVGDPAVPAGLAVTDPPRRVVLAAKYGACVRVADPVGGGSVWEVRLEPGSAFLWATPGTLAAVGFDTSESTGRELRAVLAAQAAALGLTESAPPPAADIAEPGAEA